MSNKKPLKVFLSDTFDPWFNLATEDWIFRDMDPETRILFLWRNQDTVVIGRFQNPWVECNLQKMDADGVKLARRQSGGGAVFQDLGNTNFTFMSGTSLYDRNANNTIITQALKRFDIEAFASGRNDILVGEKKISGSAFKESKDRKFHHGTMLISANLQKLADYLSPDRRKLQAKGIQSVRARVANLIEFCPNINHQNLCDALLAEFFNYYQNECPVEVLGQEQLLKIPQLRKYYQELSDHSWRLGETPQFSHHLEERFTWGQMDVHFNVEKGVINQTVIFSDSLHPEMVDFVSKKLVQISYEKESVYLAVKDLNSELPFMEKEILELAHWLKTQV